MTALGEGPTDCEDCARLRRGLTWTGKPPKCIKHQDNTSSVRFQ